MINQPATTQTQDDSYLHDTLMDDDGNVVAGQGSVGLGQNGQVAAAPDPSPVGGVKEQEPVGQASFEIAPVVETGEQEIPPEVAEFMEKVDRQNIEMDVPVVHRGKPVMEVVGQEALDDIVLPVTSGVMAVGLTKKVNTSIRWLTTWCMRIVKKFNGRVIYSDGK